MQPNQSGGEEREFFLSVFVETAHETLVEPRDILR
jgi:hypothetical protein